MAKPFTKQEGLSRKADQLCDEYDIEPRPFDPGDKHKARNGIFRMGLAKGLVSLMSCLIEYADAATGIAWPSEPTIAKWSATPLRTIQRAVTQATKLGLITVFWLELRGLKRGNIYRLNLTPLIRAFNKSRPGQEHRRQNGGSAYRQNGGSGAAKMAGNSCYLIPVKSIPVVEPSADTPEGHKDKEEGRQGSDVVNLNPSKRRDK